MDGYVVHELAPDLVVRVTRPMPPLPSDLDALVGKRWQRGADRVRDGGAGSLFNGRVFSVDRFTPTELTGHLTEYRRIVAQLEDPALFADLGLRPLAVCGVLHCADGVAVGRRPAAAIYQPGMWQLPPAGSVDANAAGPDGCMDLAAQILIELAEELGLPATAVAPPRPICVVEHPASHVSDLGMALTTPLDGGAVLAAHRAHGNSEYHPLRIVPYTDLAAFVAHTGDALVPPARVFLTRLGLL